MKKDGNRIIDELASSILKEKLRPQDWTICQICPDIAAKDYFLELVESGTHKGTGCTVQLKGHRAVKILDGNSCVAERIEVKYLTYYEKYPYPVFLVVVDTTSKLGWWIFVQKYLWETINDKNWRTRAKTTIRIPTGQTLDSAIEFRSAIHDAIVYMAARQPGVAPLALAAQAQQMEALDPRYQVEASATAKGISLRISAREETKIKLKIKGDADFIKEKVDSFIGKGLETTFHQGEIAVEGCEIFAEALRQHEAFILKWCASTTGIMSLRTGGGAPVDTPLANLPLKIEGGLDQLRLSAGGGDHPLSINIVVSRPPAEAHSKLTIAGSCWTGKSIRRLPGFEEILRLTEAVNAGSDITALVQIPGLPTFPIELPNEELRGVGVERNLPWLSLIHKARFVAENLQVDRQLPELLTYQHEVEIERLVSLLNSGEYPIDGPALEMACTIAAPTNIENAMRQFSVDTDKGELKVRAEFEIFPFPGRAE